MPSFRSIFVFATAALAGFAAAAPTAPQLPQLPQAPAAPSAPQTPSISDVGKRCDCDSLPAILVNVQAEIAGISAHLKGVIGAAADATVDVSLITPCLGDLKEVIITATAQIKALVGLDINVILASNGVVITVAACAALLLDVLLAICAVLQIAVAACLTIQISVCLGIVVQVGACICELLTVCFSLVAGIQVALCAHVGALVEILHVLNLHAVIALLVVA